MRRLSFGAKAFSLAQWRQIYQQDVRLALSLSCKKVVEQSAKNLQKICQQQKPIYGVNTGFGLLADKKINGKDLISLQRNLILSHCTGVGTPLKPAMVKLILALKIKSLSRGLSGIRLTVLQALLKLFNQQYYPLIPSQGSVGASGDLAPLSHLAAVLLGYGKVWHQGKIISAKAALKQLQLQPLVFQPKEALALINGTQVSTALALSAALQTEDCLHLAQVTAAMSMEAAIAREDFLHAAIHRARGQRGQQIMAKNLRALRKGSQMTKHHRAQLRVQDPYSLRCTPQVLGACYDQLQFVLDILGREADGVSDNPLVLADDLIISGGNFHAEPVAMVADNLALAIAEMGAIAERRIALLLDPHFNAGLPAFLALNGGVNSGYMNLQVTAAALASENKSLAHPACVDSLPTSANQEDHVSMATFAGRRLHQMLDNTQQILALELLSAVRALNLRDDVRIGDRLQPWQQRVNDAVAFRADDGFLAADIDAVNRLLAEGG